MFFKDTPKPKPSQTIYMVTGIGDQAVLKPMFIKKVFVSRLIDTPLSLEAVYRGYDKESGSHTQTQTIRRGMKNHILVLTRCGELIDLSIGKRVSESAGSKPLGELFFQKNKAKKRLLRLRGWSKRSRFMIVVDEFSAYGHTKKEEN